MDPDRFSRQSFLGLGAQELVERATIGVVGLGGGGSHIVQQLAHLGFRNLVLYDPDQVEVSNLNRLVGATLKDAELSIAKTDVARRLIERLHASANVVAVRARWQDEPRPLRACDLILGAVDGLLERSELEICARRFLIPYIDIGLGVIVAGSEPPRLSGQVVLSMPGSPCLRCLGFLREGELAQEAALYGDAGPRPQVVWANGVLASTAVGLAVDVLTNWTRSMRGAVYLSYDGNTGAVVPHPRLAYAARECVHFPVADVGEPSFIPV
jgi:hypothetical protein